MSICGCWYSVLTEPTRYLYDRIRFDSSQRGSIKREICMIALGEYPERIPRPRLATNPHSHQQNASAHTRPIQHPHLVQRRRSA